MPTDLGTTSHVIDVQPSAQHYVEMRTSAKDRAQGFLIATVPLFAAFALAVVLISVFFFSVPFMSLTALVVYWLAFVAAWLIAYVYTLATSAQGIAMFEARQKWNVIKREQEERWNYYKKLNGGE
jgi:protein-S-isoprenylcysteine O-methyltransferase Ste14